MASPPALAKQHSWPALLIKQLRAKRTQAEFGRLLGVPKNTVWRWEAGQVRPDREHGEQLSLLAEKTQFLADWDPVESIIILGDIEEGSREISEEIQEAIERSIQEFQAEASRPTRD